MLTFPTSTEELRASEPQRRQSGLLFEPHKKGQQKMVNIFEDNSSSHTARHQEPTEY